MTKAFRIAIAISSVFAFGGTLNSDDTKDEPSKEAAASPSKDNILEITVEDFTASREPFKGRPTPDGLDFDKEAVKKYIASLPENLRAKEEVRYQNISQAKAYLVKLFDRNDYTGNFWIKGRNGRPPRRLSILVTMANDDVLVTKPNSKSKRIVRHKWDELAFEQYEEFFKYFIKKRVGVAAGNTTVKESNEHAADDYLLLAMLCDWYGHYDKALEYARIAVKTNPSAKEAAEKFLLVDINAPLKEDGKSPEGARQARCRT